MKFLNTMFTGRLSRRQFAVAYLYSSILSILVMLPILIRIFREFDLEAAAEMGTMALASSIDVGGLAWIALPAILISIISFGQVVRRLHDMGRSGWWMLLMFAPFFLSIIFLVAIVFWAGEPAPNQYGPVPNKKKFGPLLLLFGIQRPGQIGDPVQPEVMPNTDQGMM